MNRTTSRIGAIGFLVAVSAAMVLPGTATAAEGVDPVVVGQCDATLKGKNGKPLTLDLGAVANAPGLLDVGLGSKSPGGDGQAEPLLSLPVKEVLDSLRISTNELVVNTAGVLCDTSQAAVNTVGAATQSLLGADNTEPGTPPDEEQPEAPNPPEEQPPAGENPENPENTEGPGNTEGPIQTAPGGTDDTGGDAGAVGDGVDSSFLPLGQALIGPAAMIGPVLPPGITPPAAPQLGAPVPPQVLAENSGTAEALPGATPPQRVPLLIAVLSVVVVAALLARTWLRRRAV